MELNKQKSQIFNSKPHTVSSTGMFNFAWDNNGNMTQRSTNNTDGNLRNLCWDEENRLMGVTDFYEFNPVKTSAYVYNAGGERVWKFSGDIQQMTINGDQLINMANISNKTLYSSPYLVANDNNYTKHYFIESERVCSKIGGGFSSPIDPVNQAIIEPINSDQPTISEDFTQHIINSISCTNIESPELNVDPALRGIEDFINIDENENLLYFSVSDHLGSSSFITDAGGEAVQHLQYLPFGEHFVNQTSTSWQTRYTFSGKEKDAETGYSYFGARYYDSDLSVWLSVDPMAGKYPSTSPFMYVRGNPIRLIDPNGMNDDVWEFNIEKGTSTKTSSFGGDAFQIVNIVDNNGNALGTQSFSGSAKEMGMSYSSSSYSTSNSKTNSYNLSLRSKDKFYSFSRTNTTKTSKKSYDYEAITSASVQMVGGLAEAAMGAGSEFLSGGASTPASLPLLIDGSARVGLNGERLYDLLMSPEQESNTASNIGGAFGQVLDYTFTGISSYGPFQAAGSIINDFGMFSFYGGTGAAMYEAQKAPTLLNRFGAFASQTNYIQSLFFDCSPLINKK